MIETRPRALIGDQNDPTRGVRPFAFHAEAIRMRKFYTISDLIFRANGPAEFTAFRRIRRLGNLIQVFRLFRLAVWAVSNRACFITAKYRHVPSNIYRNATEMSERILLEIILESIYVKPPFITTNIYPNIIFLSLIIFYSFFIRYY